MRTLIAGAVMLAGGAFTGATLANGQSHGNWESAWRDNIPTFDPVWTAPRGDWGADLPAAYPVEFEFPGRGDWGVGTEPPRHGDEGEYHCMAIGCQGDRGHDDIIQIGDCSKGPC
jgi:hypothetical protein